MRRFRNSHRPVCAAGALLVPAAAQASHSQSLTFEATSDLKDPATRDAGLQATSPSLGVHSMRVVLYWHDVAPRARLAHQAEVRRDRSRRATTGAPTTRSIDGIKARGWQLLLTVSGPVPRWATNGARDTVTRPSPAEFQKFVHAVAAHYGAKVDTWSIWNEPNQPQFLLPQYSPHKTPLSPGIYRKLYFAAQRGLADAGLAVGEGAAGRDLAARHGQGGGAADLPARRAVPGRQLPQDLEVRARRCRRPATPTTPTPPARARPSGPRSPTTSPSACSRG